MCVCVRNVGFLSFVFCVASIDGDCNSLHAINLNYFTFVRCRCLTRVHHHDLTFTGVIAFAGDADVAGVSSGVHGLLVLMCDGGCAYGGGGCAYGGGGCVCGGAHSGGGGACGGACGGGGGACGGAYGGAYGGGGGACGGAYGGGGGACVWGGACGGGGSGAYVWR